MGFRAVSSRLIVLLNLTICTCTQSRYNEAERHLGALKESSRHDTGSSAVHPVRKVVEAQVLFGATRIDEAVESGHHL